MAYEMRIRYWSSDVCSSDLSNKKSILPKRNFQLKKRFLVVENTSKLKRMACRGKNSDKGILNRCGPRAECENRKKKGKHKNYGTICTRSEERHVGKESVSTCRSRLP